MASYTLLGGERGGSLEYRLVNEERMVAYLMGHNPLLGWGSFVGGRGWAPGVYIVDSHWIIQAALFGIAGLAAMYGMLCLPPLLAARRRPVDRWPDPRNAPAAGLAMGLIMYAMDGMISFSYKPLKASMWLGFTVSAVSFVLGVYYLIDFFRHREKYGTGFTTLILCMLFLGGVQLITIGILGEYIGRIYEEIKQRPLYVVSERVGFDADVHPRLAAPLPERAQPATLT